MKKIYYRSRTFLRTVLQLRLFRNSPAIVVASTGRAGSTMLFDAIRKSFIRDRFNLDLNSMRSRLSISLCSDYINGLPDIEHNHSVVFKTHCLWTSEIARRARIIFIHADPLDSALSVNRMIGEKGNDWFRQHQFHLRATGNQSSLFVEDVLNYEGQINCWGHANDDRVLCIAFEDLWMRVDEIAAHVGFEISLPAYRGRTKTDVGVSVNDHLFCRLRELRRDVFPGGGVRRDGPTEVALDANPVTLDEVAQDGE